jgi:hypothetical protein
MVFKELNNSFDRLDFYFDYETKENKLISIAFDTSLFVLWDIENTTYYYNYLTEIWNL